MTAKKINYTCHEKEVLLSCVKLHYDVIESKIMDGAHNKAKQAAWLSVERHFNGTPLVQRRTAVQLHGLYKNLKNRAAKKRAEKQKEILKAGGCIEDMVEDDSIESCFAALRAVITSNVHDGTPIYNLQTNGDTSSLQVAEITADNSVLSEAPACIEKATETTPLVFFSHTPSVKSTFVGFQRKKRPTMPPSYLTVPSKEQSEAKKIAIDEEHGLKMLQKREEHVLTMKQKTEKHELTVKQQTEEHDLILKLKTEEQVLNLKQKTEEHELRKQVLEAKIKYYKNLMKL